MFLKKIFAKIFLLSVILVFCNTGVFGEGITGQAIYENNKSRICDISTTIHFKDGTTKEKGGTGFFRDKDANVLTAAHVIKLELAHKITKKQVDSIKKYSYWVVIPSLNRKYRAKFVGSIDDVDIGMLQVQNILQSDYSAVKIIKDPAKVKIGERDWAIGNPNNLANSLTSGIISSLHRNLNMHYIDDFIQTDCPINHGNSGCPVFNQNEEVIGIANAIYENCDGLAFAQSIALANFNLLKKGDIKPPSVGFDAMLSNFPRDGENKDSPGNEDLKEIEKMTGVEYIGDKIAIAKESWDGHCAIIKSIDEFENPNAKDDEKKPSAAKIAGLERGDLIISMNGKQIENGMGIRIFLLDKNVGDKIKIIFKRSERGKMVEKSIDLTLTRRNYISDSASNDTGDTSEDDGGEDEAKALAKKNK